MVTRDRSVSVVSPGAYCISDGGGDFDGTTGRGLFYRDMRHLSELRLRLNGGRPIPLASWVRGSEAEFALAAGVGPEGLGVVRRRFLGDGMQEEILLSNEAGEAVEVRVELECAADLRDIFELRGYHEATERGALSEEIGEGRLRFSYRRGSFRRATEVRLWGEGLQPSAQTGRLAVDLHLDPGALRVVRVSVVVEEGEYQGVAAAETEGSDATTPSRLRSRGRASLYGEVPALRTSWEALLRSWERSVEDLEELTFDAGEGLLVPAAGAPWFMALFGRDSLVAGYETMILGPEPAKSILRALARHQSTGRDDFRDAEPGKIPHELRMGELAFFGEIPETPYYGSADATPLFLILLHEVWRWTADERFVRELEGAARRALGWALEHADRTGDGYVAYATRSTAGLANQGWKDSEDSMLFRDGTRAEAPVAPCEVQGYVYDALLRSVELAQKVWKDGDLAAELQAEAGSLKERFNRDFWMKDRGYYALALDRDGRRVDSITSNAGHLLWSGIVPAERARTVAAWLMGDKLFSGWGVRTMAEGEGGYAADTYHNGSVWPHDNALICAGLQRYGLRKEANRIAIALLDAAPHFDHRLPEVFAGYSRKQAPEPVEYPFSCSPQAWAAGAVPLLVRAMLGVEPNPEERRLLAEPFPPEDVGELRLDGVRAFGGRTARSA